MNNIAYIFTLHTATLMKQLTII